MTVKPKKKLIEVALPLPEINDASAYDKMPGIGPHPKGIHHWWARLPLPTARAMLFASVVDDPASDPDRWPTEEAQDQERERLFDIIRLMMTKKLHEHGEIYAIARAEMLKHCGGALPPVLDPFSGGGSIPLEASRLGFSAHAVDLNPVAVLLNKCNLELVPPWVNRPPINPRDRRRIGGATQWKGTDGLAADIGFYASRVGELSLPILAPQYPPLRLPDSFGGGPANIVAWIWSHTVASPDPAARGRHVPIASTYVIAAKGGSTTWIDLVLDPSASDGWTSQIRTSPSDSERVAEARLGAKSAKAQALVCFLQKTPIERSYIQAEGKAGRLGTRLLAIVADGTRGRIYLPPTMLGSDAAIKTSLTSDHLAEARQTFLAGSLPTRAEITGGVCTAYGLSTWGHLFSDRQLSALIVLGDTVRTLRAEITDDARKAGLQAGEAQRYVQTVTTFLGLAIDRCADFNNILCRWSSSNEKVMNTFGKQALPMVFDYAEANTMGDAVGSWKTCSEYVAKCVKVLTAGTSCVGEAHQGDASSVGAQLDGVVVSTDPPYYDNISYATLSDFFYVWLRRTLKNDYPSLFSTMFTPKGPELIASPDRFDGDRTAAKEHFESGFRAAFTSMRKAMDARFPLTVYYAYRQGDAPDPAAEDRDNDDEVTDAVVDRTTGWQTLLEALIGSGFQITATWPVRASQKWRMVSMGTNALASYIVLACRPRPATAIRTDRRSFRAELRRDLPPAIKLLQQGNVAPVDLAQAAIGPGMAVYSRYSQILESDGSALSVRAAIAIIDQVLGEGLSEQEVDFDAESRWALAWFEQSGFAEGEFGVAETLSTAKNTSVSGLVEAGILKSSRGKVRLLKPSELPEDWDPTTDKRLTTWEMVHHLIRVLEVDGETAAAVVAAKLGSKAEVARELCYRLYTLCERKKRAPEALAYNGLVQSWPEIMRLAREAPTETTEAAPKQPQTTLFADDPTKAKKKSRGKKN